MADTDRHLPFSQLDDTRLDRLAWRVLVIGSLIRLLYAAIHPMNLAGDEAYYWEWSRRLDWGYFSKPPGIAWLMALVTSIGGDHTVTFRLTSALLGVGSLLLVRALARNLFGPRAALVGVLLALATPANVLLNFMLTIDAPLVLCWSAALWCFWRWLRASEDGSGSGAPWLIGFSLALAGGYLAKQMMLVFPLLAIVYLVVSKTHRARLKSPGFWSAVAVSLVALVPPLWWNSQHDWVTFHHTGGQIAGDTDDKPLGYTFVEFLLTQAGVLSPVIWFFVMTAALAGLARFKRLAEPVRFLVIFSAPAIVVMALMALRQTMLPNWAAVYYIAAMVLVAGWLAGAGRGLGLPAGWRKATKPALAIGFLMVAVGYLWSPTLRALGHAGDPKLDPMRRLIGHEQVAEAAAKMIEQVPNPEKTVIIALDHRYNASHLAFYLPDQPRVYRWERYDHVASQYELWPNPIDDGKTGWDAIVFVPGTEKTVTRRFQGAFEEFGPMGTFDVEVSPHYERHYRVFLGHNLLNWPEGIPLDKPKSGNDGIDPEPDGPNPN